MRGGRKAAPRVIALRACCP